MWRHTRINSRLFNFSSLYKWPIKNASPVLDPIIYADDTNLFYSNNDTETLFCTVSMDLEKINEWLKANKLSLNNKTQTLLCFIKLVLKMTYL